MKIEKKLFEDVNSELLEFDKLYVLELAKPYANVVNNDKVVLGHCTEIMMEILINEYNDNGYLRSKAHYKLMQIIEKIKDVDLLEGLTAKLIEAAGFLEILTDNMQKYNERWVIVAGMSSNTTLKQNQDIFLAVGLSDYYDDTAIPFIMFLTNFNPNTIYLEDLEEYTALLKEITLFVDLNLFDELFKWLRAHDIIEEVP